VLQWRSREVRDEFALSTSDNLAAPAAVLLAVFNENEMKQQRVCYIV
jgi:hypothetical protein